MPTLNIGVLAHVDAGKTSLTERLLFDSGAITRLGSVDAGDTRTDSGAIERRRGITIRSAVASFTVDGLDVNLIDTPGHSDFAAEVDRALEVLDAAVLVVSAVEGVQARSRVLMRALRRIGLPTIVFVNKIDRGGARTDALLADLRRMLTPHAVALNRVSGAGTARARTVPLAAPPDAFEALAEHNDALLTRLVEGPPLGGRELWAALAAQTGAGDVHPVVFGSALTGQGVRELTGALGLLRGLAERAGRRVQRPAAGVVFALDRGTGGARAAQVRLFDGRLRVRDRVRVHRDGITRTGRITGLTVAGSGADVLTAGSIATVIGLPDVRVGDRIGVAPAGVAVQVAPPSMETVARAVHAGDEVTLHAALMRLADQDPLIRTRPAPGGGTSVWLHGEVQRDVIAETLRAEFGVEVVFEPLGIVHHERLVGTGAAAQDMASQSEFVAAVGLRVEPGPHGSGTSYALEVELGGLPPAYHRALEETVRAELAAGAGPHGWAVVDCTVAVTMTGYSSVASTAGDFRGLVPVVLRQALVAAGTRVFEPCHEVEVEVPPDAVGAITGLLQRAEARIHDTVIGAEYWTVTGELPARRVHEVQQQVVGLTRGEGGWASRPGGDRLVAGPAPVRRATVRA